jgi:hypothetical protein
VPIPLVIVMILISIYLVVVPAIFHPKIGFIFPAITAVLGLILYYPFVYRKMESKLLRKLKSAVAAHHEDNDCFLQDDFPWPCASFFN